MKNDKSKSIDDKLRTLKKAKLNYLCEKNYIYLLAIRAIYL